MRDAQPGDDDPPFDVGELGHVPRDGVDDLDPRDLGQLVRRAPDELGHGAPDLALLVDACRDDPLEVRVALDGHDRVPDMKDAVAVHDLEA